MPTFPLRLPFKIFIQGTLTASRTDEIIYHDIRNKTKNITGDLDNDFNKIQNGLEISQLENPRMPLW